MNHVTVWSAHLSQHERLNRRKKSCPWCTQGKPQGGAGSSLGSPHARFVNPGIALLSQEEILLPENIWNLVLFARHGKAYSGQNSGTFDQKTLLLSGEKQEPLFSHKHLGTPWTRLPQGSRIPSVFGVSDGK